MSTETSTERRLDVPAAGAGSSVAVQTCALEGCGVPIVRHSGGGRPRLYCSDAHRAEARRRRLAGHPLPGPHAGSPIEEALALLRQAQVLLEETSATGGQDQDGAVLAEVRARATAEVLQAQQVAAEATRRAAETQGRLEAERRSWQASSEALAERQARDAAAVEDLAGALEGARLELEHELVEHHRDVETLDARLHAQAVAHETELAARATEASGATDRLRGALGALEQAERRAHDAEDALHRAGESIVALEVRAARAEEGARQATEQVERLEAAAAQSRSDLAAERAHREALIRELRRRPTGAKGAGVKAAPPARRAGGAPRASSSSTTPRRARTRS